MRTGRRCRTVIEQFSQVFLIVASYLVVAAIAAYAGLKAGAEMMRRYWEGKK